MLTIIIYILLAEIGYAPLMTWILGTMISAIVIGTFIWNIVSFLRSRASKEYVDNQLEKKVDLTEFKEHLTLYEAYKARHEQAHVQITTEIYKKIDHMNDKFDDMKSEIIDILKDKK